MDKIFFGDTPFGLLVDICLPLTAFMSFQHGPADRWGVNVGRMNLTVKYWKNKYQLAFSCNQTSKTNHIVTIREVILLIITKN